MNTDFSGLLRVIRINEKLDQDLFKATCTLVSESGSILDKCALYYLESSHSLMGRFVEAGQIWEVTKAVCTHSTVTTETGYVRPSNTIDPVQMVLITPSGKHLIWHLTHSDWYPGIGRNKASSLLDELSDMNGHHPLYTALDNGDIEKLSKAPLISEWDANVLIQGWKKHGSTNALKWFEEKEIPPSIAKQVFDFHEDNSIKAIEEDPYRLSSFNMSWDKVDIIARNKFNIKRTDIRRLQAAVTEALWGAFINNGHTKVPVNEFIPLIRNLLGGSPTDWDMAHFTMIDQSRGLLRGDFFHQYEAAVMEIFVANRIADLLSINYCAPITSEKIQALTLQFEQEQGINLTEEQRCAIKTSVSTPFSIITGGAGVGKTTVLKALYALYNAVGFKRKQLALSGKAAQRMYEATNEEATTIASYLYHFDWGDIIPADQKKMVLVIDEASMVDIHSMYKIIEKTPSTVHIILIGDPYQLPPVGAGLVLHEVVERNYLPISELSTIKRQKSESSIPKVANDIRHGRILNEVGDNVEMLEIEKKQMADSAISEYAIHPLTTQILCATNKLVAEINGKAQKRLNSKGTEVNYIFEGIVYGSGIRLGDPVICKANLYREEYDLRNGSSGQVTEVYKYPRTMNILKYKKSKIVNVVNTYGKICWDDGTNEGYITELPLEVIQNIDLAYAITIHKSQGSQYRRVILVAVPTANMDRTLVYTGITRASEYVKIIGDLNCVQKAITNPPSAANRYVGLGSFLDEIMGK